MAQLNEVIAKREAEINKLKTAKPVAAPADNFALPKDSARSAQDLSARLKDAEAARMTNILVKSL